MEQILPVKETSHQLRAILVFCGYPSQQELAWIDRQCQAFPGLKFSRYLGHDHFKKIAPTLAEAEPIIAVFIQADPQTSGLAEAIQQRLAELGRPLAPERIQPFSATFIGWKSDPTIFPTLRQLLGA